MALKRLNYTVSHEGRDQGKTFLIVEAPAKPVEWWAARVFSGLARQGYDVGLVAEHGAQGLIVIGMKGLALLPPHELKPLLDEMMSCVSVLPDRNNPQIVRPLIDNGTEGDDIEEIKTRIELRKKVAEIHLGFSLGGEDSKSEKTDSKSPAPPPSSNTPTSPAQSQRRFHPTRPHSKS